MWSNWLHRSDCQCHWLLNKTFTFHFESGVEPFCALMRRWVFMVIFHALMRRWVFMVIFHALMRRWVFMVIFYALMRRRVFTLWSQWWSFMHWWGDECLWRSFMHWWGGECLCWHWQSCHSQPLYCWEIKFNQSINQSVMFSSSPESTEDEVWARWCMQPSQQPWSVWRGAFRQPGVPAAPPTSVSAKAANSGGTWWHRGHYGTLHLARAVLWQGEMPRVQLSKILSCWICIFSLQCWQQRLSTLMSLKIIDNVRCLLWIYLVGFKPGVKLKSCTISLMEMEWCTCLVAEFVSFSETRKKE